MENNLFETTSLPSDAEIKKMYTELMATGKLPIVVTYEAFKDMYSKNANLFNDNKPADAYQGSGEILSGSAPVSQTSFNPAKNEPLIQADVYQGTNDITSGNSPVQEQDSFNSNIFGEVNFGGNEVLSGNFPVSNQPFNVPTNENAPSDFLLGKNEKVETIPPLVFKDYWKNTNPQEGDKQANTAAPASYNSWDIDNNGIPDFVQKNPPVVEDDNSKKVGDEKNAKRTTFMDYLAMNPFFTSGLDLGMEDKFRLAGQFSGYKPEFIEDPNLQKKAKNVSTASAIAAGTSGVLSGARAFLQGKGMVEQQNQFLTDYFKKLNEENYTNIRRSKAGGIEAFAEGGILSLPSEKLATGEYISGLPEVMEDKATAEVEKDEYIVTPDAVQKVWGRTHSEGGEKVALADGTKVVSDNLKIGAKLAKELNNMYDIKFKLTDTYATVIDKYNKYIGLQQVNEELESLYKAYDKNTKIQDEATKNLNLKFLEGEIEELIVKREGLLSDRLSFANRVFSEQEKSKSLEKFEFGGMVGKKAFEVMCEQAGMSYEEGLSNFMKLKKYAEGGATEQNQIQALIQAYAQISGISPEEIMQNISKLPQDKQQLAIQSMAQEVQKLQGSQQPQMEDGGELSPAESAVIKNALARNSNLDFVKRIMTIDRDSIDNGDGSFSSHLMASSDNIAYPTIVNMNGKLVNLSPEEAHQHAIKSGEYIKFNNEEEANTFATSYKKAVMGYFKQGGKQKWVSDKVALLMKEGKSQKQAVAIALNMAKEKFDDGGIYGLKKIEEVSGTFSDTPSYSYDVKSLPKMKERLKQAAQEWGLDEATIASIDNATSIRDLNPIAGKLQNKILTDSPEVAQDFGLRSAPTRKGLEYLSKLSTTELKKAMGGDESLVKAIQNSKAGSLSPSVSRDVKMKIAEKAAANLSDNQKAEYSKLNFNDNEWYYRYPEVKKVEFKDKAEYEEYSKNLNVGNKFAADKKLGLYIQPVFNEPTESTTLNPNEVPAENQITPEKTEQTPTSDLSINSTQKEMNDLLMPSEANIPPSGVFPSAKLNYRPEFVDPVAISMNPQLAEIRRAESFMDASVRNLPIGQQAAIQANNAAAILDSTFRGVTDVNQFNAEKRQQAENTNVGIQNQYTNLNETETRAYENLALSALAKTQEDWANYWNTLQKNRQERFAFRNNANIINSMFENVTFDEFGRPKVDPNTFTPFTLGNINKFNEENG